MHYKVKLKIQLVPKLLLYQCLKYSYTKLLLLKIQINLKAISLNL